jgi:hypothetical protein
MSNKTIRIQNLNLIFPSIMTQDGINVNFLVDFIHLEGIEYGGMDGIDEKVVHIKQLFLRDIARSARVDGRIWGIVEGLASHPSLDVRNEVAHLLSRLGHLRPKRALRILRGMVGDDPWVLETVALAVGMVGMKDPLSSLRILKILSKEKSLWVRKNVVSSALRILSPHPDTAIKWMERWSRDPNRYTRQTAALILGGLRTDHPSRIKILRNLCLDRYNDVRRTALLSLLRLCDGEAYDGLAEIFRLLSKDPYWRIREVVAWAMGKVGKGGRCSETLEALIYDGVGAVRKAAARSLVDLLGTESEDYLTMTRNLIKDGAELHPDVLRIIAESLARSWRLPPNLSIELLQRLGEDEDGEISSLAIDSILEIQRRSSSSLRR